MKNTHSDEIAQGERFAFGANWKAFLKTINVERRLEAELSLKEMLAVEHLRGKRFLDIGSGSGLFSLAARRLGAQVHSFDYDPQAVECTKELKKRYCKNDPAWVIEEGSALDRQYLISLGKFDIVYSWGVLHHTGNLKQALENVMISVADNGFLFISIYNDLGTASKIWRKYKKMYCANLFSKGLIRSIFIPVFFFRSVLSGLIKYNNPAGKFIHYKKSRGMSIYHNWIDWLGGYPFEVAKPEEVFNFYKKHHYVLENLCTSNGHGCNQFVFKKIIQHRVQSN